MSCRSAHEGGKQRRGFSCQRHCAHRDLHSFPTRRSSDLQPAGRLRSLHATYSPTSRRSHPALRRLPSAHDRRLGSTTEGSLRSEEHTSELQSQSNIVCRLLLEKKKKAVTNALLHAT